MSDESAETDPRRESRAALAAMLLAVAAVYHPLFLGRSLLSRDVGAWTVPARWLVRDALSRGSLPQWCPWEGIGFPVAADPLFATFYPVNLATLALPLAWGTSVYLFLHVVWGALGVFALARRLKTSPAAAAVGGVAWALSGVITSEWDGGVRLLPAAWFPWAAIAAGSVFLHASDARRCARGALALGLVGAMMALTGEVFVALMGAFFALGGGLALAPHELPDAPARRRIALAFVAAGALALALSAPSWLPAVSLVTTTARAAAPGAGPRVEWALHPMRLVDLALPRGIVDAQVAGLPAAVARFGATPLYLSAYLGVTALALASAAASRESQRWRPIASVALAGLLLAVGDAAPFHRAFVFVVRPFSRMSSPEKFVLLTQASVAVLAAMGADRVLRGDARRRLGGFALGLVALCAVVHLAAGGALDAVVARGCAYALARLAALASLLWLAQRHGLRAGIALVLAVAFDLGAVVVQHQRWEDGAHQTAPVALARDARASSRAERGAAPPRMWRSPSLDFATVPGVDPSITAQRRALLRPKFNLDTGVDVLPAYEAATSPDVDRLSRAGRVDPLRALSVDLALTPSQSPPGLTLVREVAPRARLFTVNEPLPRAFVAHAATDDPTDRLSHLIGEDVMTGRLVALGPADLARLPRRAPTERSPCVITRWSAGEVTLRCDARDDGLAVLVEQWAPGWRATVDGASASVLRVNRVAMGAPVRAGAHTVRLVYETPSLTLALGVGVGGVLAAVALALASRPRR